MCCLGDRTPRLRPRIQVLPAIAHAVAEAVEGRVSVCDPNADLSGIPSEGCSWICHWASSPNDTHAFLPYSRRGGRNAERNFRGERHSNATYASSADGDARLSREGHGQLSRLCFMCHLLMQNGNALIVSAELT